MALVGAGDYLDTGSPQTEWKLRAIAVPVVVLLAVLFHQSETGHFLQRTFLTMMVHEFGHAMTSWLSGVRAIPTLWKTMIPDQRDIIIQVIVGAFNSYLLWRGIRERRLLVTLIGGALAAAQLYATFCLSYEQARTWITFGGDGGAMVLGCVLMCCFFVDRDTSMARGGVRWGLLVIGAAAFVDTFATWVAALHNPDVIPFGEIEGVGLSDPSKLTEDAGWSTPMLVHRYVLLGTICIVAFTAIWLAAVWHARREALAR